MSIFRTFTDNQLIDHFAQFLVDSWSYSKVSTFSRNQKAFEMEYVYGYRAKSSATTVAGQAYHKALEYYFAAVKHGEPTPDLVTLTGIAFDYIGEVDARDWKLQKTSPTVEECITKANSTANDLIMFFLQDVSIYMEDIAEVLEVEFFGSEFVTVNGVDIPIPLKFRCDLVVRTKSGKIAVVDHKSKGYYTDEADIKLAIGKQAITYAIGYEAATETKVDEVWFIENKYSKNRDKSPQLVKFPIDISETDTRTYYEAMLYESLRALIIALNDPDYVYLMNDSDNYIDMAEIYDFWAKTLISEIEDFNVDDSKKELVGKRLKKIKDAGIKTINQNVIKQFRKNAAEFIQYNYSNKDMKQEEKIQHVLRTFGIIVEVAKVFDGYSSNTYLLLVGAGVKISAIQSRKLELANALDVASVRVSSDLKVWDGKAYLAIEVAKPRVKDLLWTADDIKGMKIPIGRNNLDEIVYWDLDNHSTPHALVSGSTGSGKSVSIRSNIESVKVAGVKDIYIFDPKFEFCQMGIKGVTIVSDIEEIEKTMQALVDDMNERVKTGKSYKTVIFFDEFADAQAQSRSGKELDRYELQEVGMYRQTKAEMEAGLPPQPKMARVKVGTDNSLEENLRILLQKGRSVGFRIMAATQRASSKIINGDAKANFPVLISYRLPKEIDSRVVLDEPGAESLAGRGDGLIKSPEYPELERFQAYYYQS